MLVSFKGDFTFSNLRPNTQSACVECPSQCFVRPCFYLFHQSFCVLVKFICHYLKVTVQWWVPGAVSLQTLMLQMSPPAQLHLRYHLLIWFSRLWLSHETGFRAALLRQAKHTLRRDLQGLVLYRPVAKQPRSKNFFSLEMWCACPSSAGLCMRGWA